MKPEIQEEVETIIGDYVPSIVAGMPSGIRQDIAGWACHLRGKMVSDIPSRSQEELDVLQAFDDALVKELIKQLKQELKQQT